MSKIGIIGVGHLADYTVRGLRQGGWPHPIALSPRGQAVGERLAAECQCTVMVDNQAVVDASDVVVLAPRPPQAIEALESVTLRADQVVLSVVAGVSIAEIRSIVGDAVKVVRALPVTSAEVGASPNAFYPPDEKVAEILDACGHAIPLTSEADFDAAGVMSCVYGWFFELYDVLLKRGVAAGLDEVTARKLVLGMAGGAAAIAAKQADQSVGGIARKIATEGSFTKLGLDHLKSSEAFQPWEDGHDIVLKAFRKC